MACQLKSCKEARKRAEELKEKRLNNKKQIGDCAYLTQETFTIYLNVYLELRDNNMFSPIGLDSGYINNQISQLADAVVDKTENPNSCHYKDYITTWEKDKRLYEEYIT